MVSLTRIYPGTSQIHLTINVNTRLQSDELSTPLPLGAIFNSYVSARTSYQSQQGHQLLINQWFNQDTIHTATIHWIINTTTPGYDFKLSCFNKDQLSMSTGTQALNWSISQLRHNPHSYNPTTSGAQSAINILHRHKLATINAKSMGKILKPWLLKQWMITFLR